MIACGKCSKGREQVHHQSIAAVRACFTGQTQTQQPVADYNAGGWRDAFHTDLERERETQTQAAAPTAGNRLTPPAGRYALDTADGIRFYQVDRPTEGKWAGYVFVKIQAGDETHAVRNRLERARIIAEICKDPREALLRYGREIGACGHCGRTLTNAESRAVGIGPVCAGKWAA